MLKRIFDILAAFCGLIMLSPLLIPVMILVWLNDFHTPLYVSYRVGIHGKKFQMVKLRSMVINADTQGSNSTSNDDRRITPVGKFIRKYKLDELMQLWNVLAGDMSLVGPRPQVPSGVAEYTSEEQQLLTVKPGITDIASIVFADEGAILMGQSSPDDAYNKLIRPGKSQLGIFYVNHQSILLDAQLLIITVVSIFWREFSLRRLQSLLRNHGAPQTLITLAGRKGSLEF